MENKLFSKQERRQMELMREAWEAYHKGREAVLLWENSLSLRDRQLFATGTQKIITALEKANETITKLGEGNE